MLVERRMLQYTDLLSSVAAARKALTSLPRVCKLEDAAVVYDS